jgi:tetratricopeptide (TPR) repeat protein
MQQRAIITAILLLTASPLLADVLTLTDGRSFTGTVITRDDTVLIEMPYGTLEFPYDQVLRIEKSETLEAKFERMLGESSDDDPDSLIAVAEWARNNGLDSQASRLYEQALELVPNHPDAHRGLGHVYVNNRWRSFETALELARSKLQTDDYEPLLDGIVDDLAAAADPEESGAVEALRAWAQLRSGRFEQAASTFESLAKRQDAEAGERHEAIAGLLRDNPDGMYVLSEPYPPGGALLGEQDVLPAGPASLRNPDVVQAALRDRAKQAIADGQGEMNAAVAVEPVDPEAAKLRYAQAKEHLDRADSLVPGITESYRLEIARRRIASLRSDIKGDSANFDTEMEKLGTVELSAQQYREKLIRMIHSLDNVRRRLNTILEIARPYPRQLVMEIEWGELDLQRVSEMRRALADELNGEN